MNRPVPQGKAAAQGVYLIDSKAPLPLGRQLSPLNARLSDGRTIEEAYQQAKGYATAFGPQGGKGKPAIDPNFDYEGTYRNLYQQFADENPELMNELALVLRPGNHIELVHPRAKTTQNPASVLTDIVNARRERYPNLASQFDGALEGGHRPALFFSNKGMGDFGQERPTFNADSLPEPIKAQVDGITESLEQKIEDQIKHNSQDKVHISLNDQGDLLADGKKVGQRPAGSRLIKSLTGPLGEEILEGVLGGTVAVLPQFFSQEDPRENALQLALAISGGVGIGMGARRLGAAIGGRVHEGPVKNEALQMIGQTVGQETMSEGMRNTFSLMATSRGLEHISSAQAGMLAHLRHNSDDAFAKAYPELAAKGVLPSKLSPDQIDAIDAIETEMNRRALMASGQENAESLQRLKQMREGGGIQGEMASLITEEDAAAMLEGVAKPATGADVGRAVGRIAGDNLGIIAGMGAGAMIANELGWQSDKDAQIEELRRQLAAR